MHYPKMKDRPLLDAEPYDLSKASIIQLCRCPKCDAQLTLAPSGFFCFQCDGRLYPKRHVKPVHPD